MLDQKIQDSLAQFKRKVWTWEEFTNWYGVNDEDRKLLTDVERFGGTTAEPSLFAAGLIPSCNRHHFELFLQRQELVPVKFAAAELAIPTEQLQELLDRLTGDNLPDGVYRIAERRSPNVLWRNTLRDFHKAFGSLRRTIFATHSSYIQSLHETIRTSLRMEIDTIFAECVEKSEANGQLFTTDRPQYYIDCLTERPVSLSQHVYLDFRKPAELSFDVCSWKTYVDHTESIGEIAFRPPGLTMEIETYLKNA